MIEVLTGFPINIVAPAAKGVVTRQDYQDVLEPRLELALKQHAKIRCYYELRAQFIRMEPGAMWEDFKIGAEHLMRWELVAVVTDVEWIRHAVNIFRFLMPGEVRLFSTAESAAAHEWTVAAT